jgi:hypothetical protein
VGGETRGAGVSGVIIAPVGKLRGGPDFTANTVGQLVQGRELIVSGRTYTADWFQVIFDDSLLWVHNSEINVRGDIGSLPVVGEQPQPPVPPTPPRPPAGGPWQAEYFANTGMQGRPQALRQEPGIDYDWRGQSPVPGVPATNWSARWTGSFYFDAGDYTFFASSDDGVRVYIDGHIVIDEWQEQSPQRHQNTFRGIGAGPHTVTVEYFQLGGGSSCRVMWQRA